MGLGSPDNGTCRIKGRAMKAQGVREHGGPWKGFWRAEVASWEPAGQVQLIAVLLSTHSVYKVFELVANI